MYESAGCPLETLLVVPENLDCRSRSVAGAAVESERYSTALYLASN